MADMSYATRRKLRIIKEQLGADWQDQNPGKSIDAIYNVVMGDNRKNLFCKIDPTVKNQLDEMVDYHDIKMAALVEKLVREEYDRYAQDRDARVDHVASQFAVAG
jgi:hypothetical protein